MNSGYCGEPNLGKERGGGSSKKGKKSSSDKPKQPQRGLGVAQLEKIRLHGQLGVNYLPSIHNPYLPNFSQEDIRVQTGYSSMPSSSFSYSSSSSTSIGFHPNITMGFGDYQRSDIRYGDSQPSTAASWIPGNNSLEAQHSGHTTTTRHFLKEDTQPKKNRKHRSDSMGSNSQNSESSDTEIDLELRLSI